VNTYFFTVNPDNPRCPDLSELAGEIAKDPVASWSIPGISPYLQKIRKGDRFLFLQQAGKGAPKKAPRGIIGCGDIVGRPLSGKFEKTGEAGWFVDLLFQHFIDPMKNPELRLDRKWILDQRWGQSVYFVPQSGWLVKPEGAGELILKVFLKRLARHR
jgi:hypothetical protein